MNRLNQLFCIFFVGCMTNSSFASPILITELSIGVFANDLNGNATGQSDNDISPGTRTVSALDGNVSSTSTRNLSTSGASTVLEVNFDLQRYGRPDASAETNSGLTFTALQNATFSLTGQITADDVGSAGYLWRNTSLIDKTLHPIRGPNSDFTFINRTESYSTIDENFVLGSTGDGDSLNYSVGSLTGNLIAGHEYAFYYDALITAYPTGDQGSSASGDFQFSIVAVPEPSLLVLFTISIGFLAWCRRLQISLKRGR